MAIKVTLGATENTQQKKPFPKLMECTSGAVWLMFAETKGMYIKGGVGDFQPLHINHYFNLREFTDYNEPITIQNL